MYTFSAGRRTPPAHTPGCRTADPHTPSLLPATHDLGRWSFRCIRRPRAFVIIALTMRSLMGQLPAFGMAPPAANLPPVNTLPASFSVNEDTPLSLAGLSIADADAGAGSMTVTLTVGSGMLSAASSTTVKVTGSGTGTMVLTGTVANINAFLSAASRPLYNGALDGAGAVALTMTTNDNGNTGTGGARTDVDNSTITVVAVNDVPFVDLDGPTIPANLVTNGHFLAGSTTGWTLSAMTGNPSGPLGGTTSLNSSLTTDPAGTSASGALWLFGDNDGAIGPSSVVAKNTTALTLTNGSLYTFSFDVRFTTDQVQAVNFSWVVLNASNQAVMTVPGRYTTGGSGANASATAITLNTWRQFQATFQSSLPTGSYTIGLTWDTAPATNGDADDVAFDRIYLGEQPVNRTLTYTENGSGSALADVAAQLVDADHANMASVTLTLTNPQTGDRLLVNGSAAASGTLPNGIAWTRTDDQVVLSGAFTKAQYASVLALVQFHNTTDDPNSAVTRDVTVTASDGTGTSNTAHAFVTVVAVNDAPLANDDDFTLNEGQPLNNASMIGNDSDVDNTNAQLSYTLVSGGTAATNGTLQVNTNGTFDFAPDPLFIGTVNFTYRVCDGGPLCDQAVVTIMVPVRLPVELLTFEGRSAGARNHLIWSTASERNSDRFEVERSTDAVQFAYIGMLAAAGSSQAVLDYAFDDDAPPPGVNYYRLKQVDTDGVFEYSPTIALVTAGAMDDRGVILADPAGVFLLGSEATNSAQVELLNTQGQVVRSAVGCGGGRCQVDLRGLPAAMYIARVSGNGHMLSYKLMAR